MAGQPDVVIIGGGAIGCSAAYYLRSEGLQVALVDKGPVAREASWASAGIIGPSSHPRGDPWFLQATRLSRQLYDDLNPVLFEETGRWMGYGGRGSMTLAMNPGEAAESTADAERESAAGVALEVLTGSEARRREPALPQNLEAVILHPEGRFLDARNYTATIARAAQLKGVKMRPGWPVTALLWDGARVTGVRSGPRAAGRRLGDQCRRRLGRHAGSRTHRSGGSRSRTDHVAGGARDSACATLSTAGAAMATSPPGRMGVWWWEPLMRRSGSADKSRRTV